MLFESQKNSRQVLRFVLFLCRFVTLILKFLRPTYGTAQPSPTHTVVFIKTFNINKKMLQILYFHKLFSNILLFKKKMVKFEKKT